MDKYIYVCVYVCILELKWTATAVTEFASESKSIEEPMASKDVTSVCVITLSTRGGRQKFHILQV